MVEIRQKISKKADDNVLTYRLKNKIKHQNKAINEMLEKFPVNARKKKNP